MGCIEQKFYDQIRTWTDLAVKGYKFNPVMLEALRQLNGAIALNFRNQVLEQLRENE